MDEDREWGMVDEDEMFSDYQYQQQQQQQQQYGGSENNSVNSSKKNSMYLDVYPSLVTFAQLSILNNNNNTNTSSADTSTSPSPSTSSTSSSGTHGIINNTHMGPRGPTPKSFLFPLHPIPARDRRSSTGSFIAQQTGSPCAMETFVAGRRGSASSVSSNPGLFTAMMAVAPHAAQGGSFPEGDALLPSQPIGSMPFISKRSSSQAYRQQRSMTQQQQQFQHGLGTTISLPGTPPLPVASLSHSASIQVTGGQQQQQQEKQAGMASAAQSNQSWVPFLSSTSTTHSTVASSETPMSSTGAMATISKAASIFKDALDDKIHPVGQQQHHHHHHHHQFARLSYNPWAQSSNPSPAIDYTAVNIPFMEIKDVAVAEQLTCVEYGLFKKLKPRDMLRQVWKTKKGSAAFQACISHFNFISSWVGTMILTPTKPKHRAKMMEKFISIAKILRDMGNFNTTMAIIGAMNTSSIHRLVQTRELLQSKDSWTTFKELEHLMSSERSFFEYRTALRAAKLPCIPYLGVHLGDLLSISEGNRDFRPVVATTGTGIHHDMTTTTTTTTTTMVGSGMMLHWQKFVLITDVISMVMAFQQDASGMAAYHRIQPDPFISRVITDTHVLDDEELYAKSVLAEPPLKLNHSRSLSKFTFF
ncbi:hypothetical protein EDD11_000797 [Mortierella claussenii]|nr:hypothetical protein EDD11_000797 [Mortierella claussenii]